ncbi:uncharacterized protein LOC119465033 [Dermacentor silvarum]|uniref:uncharacterized protein LOC119465033 n=1 Tax=Dermacentor silvarum TaxID=543639 RepID=UPI0018988DF3|nr:uncharacterized protein LOC119465033 [Dermacentor silvarum]
MRSYNVKTWGKESTCLYSKVESYNDKTITMRQGYTPRTHKGLIYPVTMKVSWTGGTDVAPRLNASTYADFSYMRVYRFHYHDRNDHCAVLTFTDDSGTIRCELHTWKSYRSDKYYTKCKEEYEYQCPGRKIYYPDLTNCPNLS